MATLKQIAEEAGVSIMTVSNVINNKHTKVSKKTINKVNSIIKKYNYVPNMSARSLSTNKSRIVGLLLPVWEGRPDVVLSDPYYSLITGLLQNHLSKHGYFVMIHTFYTADDVDALLKNWNIDGAILVFPHRDEITRSVLGISNLPLVVIDRYFDDLDTLTVGIDDYRGGYLAAKYLISKGHKKIAFVGPPTLTSSVVRDRFVGFQFAMHEASLSVNPDWIFEVFPNYEDGVKVGMQAAKLHDRPTAFLTTVDILAVGLIEGMRQNGFHAPEDFSLTGFDNDPVSTYCVPKLTTIHQNIDEKAGCAVKLLFEAMQEPELKRRRIILDVSLVERDSVKDIRYK